MVSEVLDNPALLQGTDTRISNWISLCHSGFKEPAISSVSRNSDTIIYQGYCLDSSWTLRFHQLSVDFWEILIISLFRVISQQLKPSSTFSSLREEIHELEVNLENLLSFSWKHLFKVLKPPKPRCPSNTNSRHRDKESLNSSTQAKPSPARGAAWGAAQARCRSAALPSDYITRPVALVQHCIVVEGQHRQAAGSNICSREAEEHLSGMQTA